MAERDRVPAATGAVSVDNRFWGDIKNVLEQVFSEREFGGRIRFWSGDKRAPSAVGAAHGSEEVMEIAGWFFAAKALVAGAPGAVEALKSLVAEAADAAQLAVFVCYEAGLLPILRGLAERSGMVLHVQPLRAQDSPSTKAEKADNEPLRAGERMAALKGRLGKLLDEGAGEEAARVLGELKGLERDCLREGLTVCAMVLS